MAHWKSTKAALLTIQKQPTKFNKIHTWNILWKGTTSGLILTDCL